jgi:hypothetical protein
MGKDKKKIEVKIWSSVKSVKRGKNEQEDI